MSNDIQLHERSALPAAYEPRNIGELRQFAQEVTATQLVPQGYRGKPADAMVAMMYGKETANLGPLASLQYIAVINGRPAFYGDALPGIAFNKGLVVDMDEALEGEPGKDSWTAVCTVTRPSGSKVTQRFSVADARRAGLWDKAGPWKQYPQRMLQWRARSWAIRDAAPHMLFGPTYEELRDAEDYQGPDNAREINPRPTAADRRAAMQAAALVEVYDADGELHMLQLGEVEQFLIQQKELLASDDAAEAFAAANREHIDRSTTLSLWDEERQAGGGEIPEEAPVTTGGNGANGNGKSVKERAKEIAAALRDAPNEAALKKLYARLASDVTKLPEQAQTKIAEIYDEVLKGFAEQQPGLPMGGEVTW